MDQQPEISVLAVEDDVAIRRLLRAAFENTRFKLLEAATAAEGRDLLLKRRPELVLLDLGLPDSDGQDFIETVREWCQTPIIIISGNDQDKAKVSTLQRGRMTMSPSRSA